jgi:hypothetical protein
MPTGKGSEHESYSEKGEESMAGKGQKGWGEAMHTAKVSAGQIQMYLKGVDYPVTRDELIRTAKQNNAPEMIISFLNKIPDKQYRAPTEVEAEFSKMK